MKISEVLWSSHKVILRRIRHEVFVKEQGVSPEDEWDINDGDARHFLAFDEIGLPIGCVRITENKKIGRMAVQKNQRGKRIGSQLLLTALNAIPKKEGFAVLASQLTAMPLYAFHGFDTYDILFNDAGMLHRRMKINLINSLKFSLGPKKNDHTELVITHQNKPIGRILCKVISGYFTAHVPESLCEYFKKQKSELALIERQLTVIASSLNCKLMTIKNRRSLQKYSVPSREMI